MATTGGSRIEGVLDPSFVEGLEELPSEEVRRRRDEAFAEREFHSYLRRLIQVRQDIVRAERERRSEGRAPDPLIDRITSVLSEGPPRGPARGEALSLGPSPEDMAEAERQADLAAGGVLSDPATLDDATLDRALQGLAEHEHRVSSRRLAVLRVHDRL